MAILHRLATSLNDEMLTSTKLVDDTGVLLDVESLQVYSLNETGMFVVEEVGRGVTDQRVLIERMVDEFEVDEETARRDLEAFLVDLEAIVPGRTNEGSGVVAR